MAWGDYTQAFLALMFVLALIGLLTMVARRFGYGSPTPTIGHKNKRVHIVEVTQLDAKRRLVLVRRDDREHLLLLGHDREQIVEADITTTNSAQSTLTTSVGGSNSAGHEGDPKG